MDGPRASGPSTASTSSISVDKDDFPGRPASERTTGRNHEEVTTLANETLTATTTVQAPAEAVFAILADPGNHPAIDGTGWVKEPVDRERLAAPGQIFRMTMYHPSRPDGTYEMANKVQVFDPPKTISWQPGRDSGDGTVRFGGWLWRYDLVALGPSQTEVALSYDWSGVSDEVRQRISFPPFSPDHLDNSLAHLAALAAS